MSKVCFFVTPDPNSCPVSVSLSLAPAVPLSFFAGIACITQQFQPVSDNQASCAPYLATFFKL
jgi:hypothetical protein